MNFNSMIVAYDFKLKVKDAVQRSILFYYSLLFAFFILRTFGFYSEARKISFLILRFFPTSESRLHMARYLVSQPVPKLDPQSSFCLHYCLIIKKYVSPKEKGIILVSFEKQLDKLSSHPEISKIINRYFVIFVPSTTGYFSDALLRFKSLNEHSFATFPVHQFESDISKIIFGNDVICFNYNAASWVNCSRFFSKSRDERSIDCLMVANFGAAKRHWMMFKVLKRLPKSVRLTCVGFPVGKRDKASLLTHARFYGVDKRVEVIENPTQEVLRDCYSSAKVFCATSYIEGSLIGVAEALASGTPVIMFDKALIGTKRFISQGNGYLVHNVKEYADKILEVLKGVNHDNIRMEAKENVDAFENSIRLNSDLRQIFVNNGMDWSEDIHKFYSQKLTSRYFDESSFSDLDIDYLFFKELGVTFSI